MSKGSSIFRGRGEEISFSAIVAFNCLKQQAIVLPQRISPKTCYVEHLDSFSITLQGGPFIGCGFKTSTLLLDAAYGFGNEFSAECGFIIRCVFIFWCELATVDSANLACICNAALN